MDLLFSASILASFLAGLVALFAPCCVTILLPAYLASVFRERRKILLMTFVFFFGVAAILIPIGLGAAALAQIFQDFHKELYIFGGAFMLLLSAMSLTGKNLSLPLPRRLKDKSRLSGATSVFVLGIFSGAATSCCAPVLAGAMTLAILSGAFWKALVVVFAYVFGITFPLFVLGYFYDRLHLDNISFLRGRSVTIKLFGKTYSVHSANLLSAAVFLFMGVMLLILSFTANLFWAPQWQVAVSNYLNRLSQNLVEHLSSIPDIVWGITIIIIFASLAAYAAKSNYD